MSDIIVKIGGQLGNIANTPIDQDADKSQKVKVKLADNSPLEPLSISAIDIFYYSNKHIPGGLPMATCTVKCKPQDMQITIKRGQAIVKMLSYLSAAGFDGVSVSCFSPHTPHTLYKHLAFKHTQVSNYAWAHNGKLHFSDKERPKPDYISPIDWYQMFVTEFGEPKPIKLNKKQKLAREARERGLTVEELMGRCKRCGKVKDTALQAHYCKACAPKVDAERKRKERGRTVLVGQERPEGDKISASGLYLAKHDGHNNYDIYATVKRYDPKTGEDFREAIWEPLTTIEQGFLSETYFRTELDGLMTEQKWYNSGNTSGEGYFETVKSLQGGQSRLTWRDDDRFDEGPIKLVAARKT